MTDQPMKVVFYTRPGFLDPAFSLVSSLSKQAEVHLIVEVSPEGRGSGAFGLPYTDLPAGLLPLEALRDWPPPDVQAKLHGLASFHLAVYNTRRAFHPRVLRTCCQVARFIYSIRPEVVHFDEASSRGLSLPYLLLKFPMVVTIHDSQAVQGQRMGRFTMVRRLFIRRAASLVFRSRYSKERFFDLQRLILKGVNVHVIPLGIYDIFRGDCDRELSSDKRTVLSFGRLTRYKGVETLCAAMPLVAKQVPGAKFIVAGKPSPGYDLPEPPQLPNGGICEYRLRLIAGEERRHLFKTATLVVLPYNESNQSGVVSTAYAFHKPVVATTVGGIPEVVEDGVTGRLVPPRDPVSLADAIVELLQNPSLRQAMSDNIRKKEQNELSWTRLAEATLTVYRQAIRTRQG